MARPPKNLHIPMRNGVSASSLALPSVRNAPWVTVLAALVDLLPRVPHAEWHARMANGQVMDERGQPLPPDTPFQKCLRVYYWRDLPQEPPIPFAHTVLFRDEHLLVADKPHFLPVTPGGRYVKETLLARLKDSLNLPELSPLHRLDRETAGVVAFCLRPQDRDAYQRLFRERQVHKVYEAIGAQAGPSPLAAHVAQAPDPAAVSTVDAAPDTPLAPPHVDPLWQPSEWPITRQSHIRENPTQFFRMAEAPPAEHLPPNSETRIELLATQRGPGPGHGYFRLTPVTGKRHQLRVHMAALGWPLVGDQFYPNVQRQPGEMEDFAHPLQLLARQLAFTDPVTGAMRCFDSQLSLRWPVPRGADGL